MPGWFGKIRTVLRRSRAQAPPSRERQDRAVSPLRPASLRVGPGPSDPDAEAAEAFRDALSSSGLLVIDHDALRAFSATRRSESHASGSRSDELWATFSLVNDHQERGDLDAATAYATEMLHLMEQDRPNEEEEEREPPSRGAVYETVLDLAESQFNAENYGAARDLVEAAIRLVPDDPQSHHLLGLALRGLERPDEALTALDRALALAPSISVLHAHRADMLGELGRVNEAADAIDRALALEPGNSRIQIRRGDLRQMLGQHEAAVADYDRVIAGAGQRGGGQPTAEDEPDPSLADRAALSRLRSLQALGRVDAVIYDAGRLISEGSPRTALDARMLLGELYESLGRPADAMDVYAGVLAAGYGDGPARVRRARLFLEQGAPDEAVAELAPLIADQEQAANAIPVLLDLLRRSRKHARARKALGQAYLSSWQPAKAHVALTAAMAALPDDWELRYARAMAAITYGDETDEQEEAWNSSFSIERALQAVEDLVTASANTADREVQRALRWLVDRVGALIPVWLTDVASSADRRYVEALPELVTAAEMEDAAEAGSEGRWREAVNRLVAVRALLAAADMPILTARADLRLADCYLRLYEIQNSLDHLDAAAEGISFLGMPLDEGARRQFQEIRERELKLGNKPTLQDYDHRHLWEMTDTRLGTDLAILRMQVMARIGDPKRAASVIKSAGVVLAWLSQGKISRGEALVFGRLLRDAGRFAEALQIAEHLEADSDPDDLVDVHNLASTVFLNIGDLDAAAEHSRAALKHVRRPAEATAIVSNLAASYLQRDDPEEALRLLDAYPLPSDPLAQVRVGYLVTRGEALRQQRDFAGAQREFIAALDSQDEIRGRLRSFDDRMQWHAQQINLYESAVRAAVLNKDSMTALELVERSKARSFVDQLAAGPAPESPEEDDLNEVFDQVAARRTLLRRLAAAGNYVDLELVQQFAALGGSTDLVERGEDGSVRLSAERLDTEVASTDAAVARLEDEMEESRRKSVQSIVGELLSRAELCALLAGARRKESS